MYIQCVGLYCTQKNPIYMRKYICFFTAPECGTSCNYKYPLYETAFRLFSPNILYPCRLVNSPEKHGFRGQYRFVSAAPSFIACKRFLGDLFVNNFFGSVPDIVHFCTHSITFSAISYSVILYELLRVKKFQ